MISMQFNLMQFLAEWKGGATERLNYLVICMPVYTIQGETMFYLPIKITECHFGKEKNQL